MHNGSGCMGVNLWNGLWAGIHEWNGYGMPELMPLVDKDHLALLDYLSPEAF